MTGAAPLVDEDNTHVYEFSITGIVDTAANPNADPAELRKSIVENALDWLHTAFGPFVGEKWEKELIEHESLFSFKHIESRPD